MPRGQGSPAPTLRAPRWPGHRSRPCPAPAAARHSGRPFVPAARSSRPSSLAGFGASHRPGLDTRPPWRDGRGTERTVRPRTSRDGHPEPDRRPEKDVRSDPHWWNRGWVGGQALLRLGCTSPQARMPSLAMLPACLGQALSAGPRAGGRRHATRPSPPRALKPPHSQEPRVPPQPCPPPPPAQISNAFAQEAPRHSPAQPQTRRSVPGRRARLVTLN